MYDADTQHVIDSRQRCPECGGESRLFERTQPEWRYEIRCRACKKVWTLKTRPRTLKDSMRLDQSTVRKAISEWNAIAMKAKKGADHEGT